MLDVYRKEKLSSQASTKQGSGPAGQGPKRPFIAHHEPGYCHASTRATQAYRTALTSVWAWGHTYRELMVFWPPALSKPWLESWMKLTSIQFCFLWKSFSMWTNVFRRTFLWHASMTNDKSHLILFKQIRSPKVVCELLSKEHPR